MLFFVPRGVLDEILNLIESVSEGFPSYFYISQLIRFARVSSHVTDFNARNKILPTKLLQQGYRYHKLRKAFSKSYRRHHELVPKVKVGLKTLFATGPIGTRILW